MLETIGTNKEPMSSYQIKKAMKGLGDTYVYDMIEEMVPTRKSIGEYLFCWDDLFPLPTEDLVKAKPDDRPTWGIEYGYEPRNVAAYDSPNDDLFSKRRSKLFDKFDRMYGLNWLGTNKLYCEDSETERGQYDTLLKWENDNDNDRFLTISCHSNQIVGIGLNAKEDATMIIHSGDKKIIQQLLTRRKSRKLHVYLPNYTSIPVRYLNNITINERGQRLISEIKNQLRIDEPDISDRDLEISPEVRKIKDERQYWKYSLNIRGFILYVLGIIQLAAQEKKVKKEDEWKKEGRRNLSYNRRRRIEKTLEILSDNHLHDFPFLLYYRKFKEVLPSNFIIDLLKQIAEELQYQLDTADIDFLKYWVNRRYYDAITNHFGALERISPFLFMKIDTETHTKLKDFRIKLLSNMAAYLTAELQYREKALESYKTD